jgi:hypothetical protein
MVKYFVCERIELSQLLAAGRHEFLALPHGRFVIDCERVFIDPARENHAIDVARFFNRNVSLEYVRPHALMVAL